MNRQNRRNFIFGVLFLLVQVLSIIYARFVPERFFCWAPYDIHTEYVIHVRIDDQNLSKDEISKRYRYSSKGWDPRSIYNVISLVLQYETTYGKEEGAQVKIIYSINGKPAEVWEYPI